MPRTLALLLSALVAPAVAAAAPVLLTHHGMLLDREDGLVEDPAVPFVFRFFTAKLPGDTSDRLIWESGTCPVAVSRGQYAVVLGETCEGATPLDAVFANDEHRFLEVSIDGQPMLPRLRITAAPFALRAAEAVKALDSARLGGLTVADLDARFAPASGASGYVQLDPAQTQAGGVNVSGTVLASAFNGAGRALTDLDASALAHGTVGSARIAGAYGEALQLTNEANEYAGHFAGDVSGTLSGTFQGTLVDTQLQGEIRLPTQGTLGACGSANMGAVVVNAQDGALYLCGSTGWKKPGARPGLLRWSPAQLDLGVVFTNGTKTATATLSNPGGEDVEGLEVTAAPPNGPFQVQSSTCAGRIAAGGQCTVTLALAAGAATGALSGWTIASAVNVANALIPTFGFVSPPPDAFTFTAVTGAALDTAITSNAVTLAGFIGALPATLAGEASAVLVVNGTAAGRSANVSPGQTLAVRLQSANDYELARSATVTLGTRTATFGVTTRSRCATGQQIFASAGTTTFQVPTGCTQVSVKMWGGGAEGSGGAGGYSTAALTVTPGESLSVRVAAPGTGVNGAGASRVLRGSTDLIVAGGGGAAGVSGGQGGAGGGATGQRGANSCNSWGCSGSGSDTSAGGGGGGTASGPGAGGIRGYGNARAGGPGSDGSGAQGGAGGTGYYGAGGGGGEGYFGGGGGGGGGWDYGSDYGNDAGSGGGGGGSGYAPGGSTVTGDYGTPGNAGDSDRGTAGDRGAPGKVVVRWGN